MRPMLLLAGMLVAFALQGCATAHVSALNDGAGTRTIETRLSSTEGNSLESKMARQERRIAHICGGQYEFVDGDALSLVTTPRHFYLLTKFRCA